jgi:flavodoxin
MKAVVLYYSHKGKTAGLAREIAMYLWSKGISVSLSSISDANLERLPDCDFLISGCWTCGWFLVGQHPHKRWKDFAKQIRGIVKTERTLLFTTYKFRTGSMYACMKRAAGISRSSTVPFIQSRTGFLTDSDKKVLDRFININSIH